MLSRRVLSLVNNCTRASLVFRPRLLLQNHKTRNYITLSRAALSETEPHKKPSKGGKIHEVKDVPRALPLLNRIRKKRPLTSTQQERQKSVVALSLAESFDLDAIHSDALFSSLYNVSYIDRDCDDALYMTKKKEYNVNDELSEMFLFEEGVVVFWNVEANQRVSILRDLERFANGAYDSKIALEEQDRIPFVIVNSLSLMDGYVQGFSGIKSDTFYLDERKHNSEQRSDPQSIIQRFALSQGFAASVKIGVWETLLNELSEPLSESTRQLKEGKIPWNQSQALRKSGEFAALRHAINLDCNLLNRDFYWNREDVEKYCEMSVRHFLVDRRLRALNARLDYCEEFVKMVDNMLALRHASNLEWMIIVLIVIEVIFDIFHFADSSPKKVIVVTEPVVAPQ